MNLRSVCAAIVAAINKGAPEYNRGDVPQCASVYREATLRILTDEISGFPRDALQKALELTEATSSADEQAWAFRSAFDAILEYADSQTAVSSQLYSTGGEILSTTNLARPGSSGRHEIVYKNLKEYCVYIFIHY